MSKKIQQRYVLAAMLFFAVMIGLAERSVLTMAITRMVHIPNQNVNESTISSQSFCAAPKWAVDEGDGSVIIDQAQYGVKYNWTQEEQGIILAAFFIGYVITHIPGGMLAQNFGGKYVLGMGVMLSAILSMIIPLAVEYGGAVALIAIRVLMGACQGPMFPAMIQLLSMWAPTTERAFMTLFCYTGMAIGVVIASYFSGIIMFYYSWELVFYVFGAVAIVWFIFFVFLCYDNPASHPFISTAEKEYLLKELGQLERDRNQSATPWRQILTSRPVWALVLAYMCSDWTHYVTSTTLPKYMNDVLRFSIRDVGAFSSLPWILRTILAYAFGIIIDRAIAQGRISVTNARKLAVFLASAFPAIFLIAASYAECAHTLVVILFTISVGMHAFISAGLSINPIDLSPNYAGTLMGMANGSGALTGILAPYTVGLLTPNAYLSEWRLVFWITFAIHLLKFGIFAIWGSGEIQQWNMNRNNVVNEPIKNSVKNETKFC